ncbi:hypothetical protein A4X13_0g135 [Tilletia indica]|uniref:Uncharacterized protein n=1 Tax=Tilletia indica TaxID=43049 RepID=A0A177TM12_9BASI|nr:hypothetical protein A4X13_0g135 [Tilletia indica]
MPHTQRSLLPQMSSSSTLSAAHARGLARRSSRSRSYRLLGTAIALSYTIALPLVASAVSSPRDATLPVRIAVTANRGHLISTPASRSSSSSEPGLVIRVCRVIMDRLENGGTALPRDPMSSISQSSILRRQIDNAAIDAKGPESDQPLYVGSTAFGPLILLIAGMGFAFVCAIFLLVIINCWNPNNSQTGRDRLRAQQDLRLRGAGRRSAVEPYVFGTTNSGASTPRYGGSAPVPAKVSRNDRRPPPRAGLNSSISSRTPLYASHLSQVSGSVASDRLFPSPGSQKGGHNSYMSSSSGPFGDSMAALSTETSSRQLHGSSAPHLPHMFGDRTSYRPSPLPQPPMQQMYEITPASPRGPRPATAAAFLQGQEPRTRTQSDIKASRSSTIGRGTDIYRNRGSRAFVPAVNPSAVAPAYPNWARDYSTGAHPLQGPPELRRHQTDPPPGSLSASRRNSMLSLSMGSNSNEGSVSPNHTGALLGGGAGGAGSGRGTSPDSASSSLVSTFSNGLTTGPLLPLGSSYLSSSNAGNAVPTGDLVGSGFFGSTGVPPVPQRRSPVSAGSGYGGPPPIPAQKSVYHTRPPPQNYLPPLEFTNSTRQNQGPAGPRALNAQGQAPVGRSGSSGAQQRYDDDLEAAGANVQSGLLASNQQGPGIGLAAARAGRYARRPGGPR